MDTREWASWAYLGAMQDKLASLDDDSPSVLKLVEDVDAAYNQLTPALALCLRDVLFCMCMGEARHAKAAFWDAEWYGELDGETMYRDAIYKKSLRYSPQKNLPLLQDLFMQDWGGGKGGPAGCGGIKWAEIAKGAMLYGTVSDTVFLDHCTDLQHNGHRLLSKETVMGALKGVTIHSGESGHLIMLFGHRKNGALFTGGAVGLLSLDTRTARLLGRVLPLIGKPGLANNLKATYEPDWLYEPKQWGDKVLADRRPPLHGFVCELCGARVRGKPAPVYYDDGGEHNVCDKCRSSKLVRCPVCLVYHDPAAYQTVTFADLPDYSFCPACATSVQTCHVCGGHIAPPDLMTLRLWRDPDTEIHVHHACLDGHYAPCHSCMHWLAGNEIKHLDDCTLCADCLPRYSETCADCGTVHHKLNMTGLLLKAGGERRICKSCMAHYDTCPNCHRSAEKGSLEEVSENYGRRKRRKYVYCRACLDKMGYIRCVSCHKWQSPWASGARMLLAGQVCGACYSQIRGLTALNSGEGLYNYYYKKYGEGLPAYQPTPPEVAPPETCKACGREIDPKRGKCKCDGQQKGQKAFRLTMVERADLKLPEEPNPPKPTRARRATPAPPPAPEPVQPKASPAYADFGNLDALLADLNFVGATP